MSQGFHKPLIIILLQRQVVGEDAFTIGSEFQEVPYEAHYELNFDFLAEIMKPMCQIKIKIAPETGVKRCVLAIRTTRYFHL